MGGGCEEFYSFNGDDEDDNIGAHDHNMIAEDDSEDDDEEEEVSDHEYHTEEKTVGKRIKPYR